MDPERALTVVIVAFVAGSTTALIALTAAVSLTESASPLLLASVAVAGVGAAVLTGLTVHRNADDEQLTGR